MATVGSIFHWNHYFTRNLYLYVSLEASTTNLMDAIFLKTKIKSHVLTNNFLKVQKTFKETRDTTGVYRDSMLLTSQITIHICIFQILHLLLL